MTKNQFGFKPKLSTKDALVNIMEDVQNDLELYLNVKYATFIDLRKALDTVSQDTVLQKAENFRLRGPIQALLKPYYKNRSQLVKTDSKMSKLKIFTVEFRRDQCSGHY